MSVDAWTEFCEAEDNFYAKRIALIRSKEFGAKLIEALNSADDSDPALRLLDGVCIEKSLLEPALPLLVDLAIDGPVRSMGLASKVLRDKFSDEDIRKVISARMTVYLSSDDYFLYRRLAQVLQDHNLRELLTGLELVCRDHRDPDIREISADLQQTAASSD